MEELKWSEVCPHSIPECVTSSIKSVSKILSFECIPFPNLSELQVKLICITYKEA